MLNKVRPFNLVFLLRSPGRPFGEAGQTLDSTLGSAIAKGLFDFLDSPPVIRFVRLSTAGGCPGWDQLPRALSYPSYTFEVPM